MIHTSDSPPDSRSSWKQANVISESANCPSKVWTQNQSAVFTLTTARYKSFVCSSLISCLSVLPVSSSPRNSDEVLNEFLAIFDPFWEFTLWTVRVKSIANWKHCFWIRNSELAFIWQIHQTFETNWYFFSWESGLLSEQVTQFFGSNLKTTGTARNWKP